MELNEDVPGTFRFAGKRKAENTRCLKSFLGRAVGFSEKDSGSEATQATLKISAIKTLIEFFPIGKKLRYYPEFHTDIVLDTIIVAYCVNGHFVYSLDAIEFDAEGSSSNRSGLVRAKQEFRRRP